METHSTPHSEPVNDLANDPANDPAIDLTNDPAVDPAIDPAIDLAIDAEILKLNLEALGDEAAECLVFLTETFFQDSPEQLQNMRLGAEQSNFDQVRFNAHTMKSSSATLGASKLSEYCMQLEAKARSRDASGMMDLVNLLEAEYDRVKAALENFEW
jgi:HPt (histidine-containing phosphotransfer) domain-containing protein